MKKHFCPNCNTDLENASFNELVTYVVRIGEDDGEIVRDSIVTSLDEGTSEESDNKPENRYYCENCGHSFDKFSVKNYMVTVYNDIEPHISYSLPCKHSFNSLTTLFRNSSRRMELRIEFDLPSQISRYLTIPHYKRVYEDSFALEKDLETLSKIAEQLGLLEQIQVIALSVVMKKFNLQVAYEDILQQIEDILQHSHIVNAYNLAQFAMDYYADSFNSLEDYLEDFVDWNAYGKSILEEQDWVFDFDYHGIGVRIYNKPEKGKE